MQEIGIELLGVYYFPLIVRKLALLLLPFGECIYFMVIYESHH